MRLIVIPQGIRRVLPALVNQFIGNVKDSRLVYFLGLLASEREIFRVGQDQAVVTGNLSPLLLAGVFYLVITVPLTHFVNYIDARLRLGKQGRGSGAASGLIEVSELQAATGPGPTAKAAEESTPRFKGGALNIRDLTMSAARWRTLEPSTISVWDDTTMLCAFWRSVKSADRVS